LPFLHYFCAVEPEEKKTFSKNIDRIWEYAGTIQPKSRRCKDFKGKLLFVPIQASMVSGLANALATGLGLRWDMKWILKIGGEGKMGKGARILYTRPIGAWSDEPARFRVGKRMDQMGRKYRFSLSGRLKEAFGVRRIWWYRYWVYLPVRHVYKWRTTRLQFSEPIQKGWLKHIYFSGWNTPFIWKRWGFKRKFTFGFSNQKLASLISYGERNTSAKATKPKSQEQTKDYWAWLYAPADHLKILAFLPLHDQKLPLAELQQNFPNSDYRFRYNAQWAAKRFYVIMYSLASATDENSIDWKARVFWLALKKLRKRLPEDFSRSAACMILLNS